MGKIYKLIAEKEQRNDMDFDAIGLPFEGDRMFGSNMIGTDEFDYPKRIFYLANFDYIPQRDFIHNDTPVPIMSTRLIELLRSIQELHIKVVPVTLIDDQYFGSHFDSSGQIHEEVPRNENFGAVQMTRFENVFDYELSEYERDDLFEDDVAVVYKLVLNEPESGFAPLFKIEEYMSALFVTEEARSAIENAGFLGCLFEEVEVSS